MTIERPAEMTPEESTALFELALGASSGNVAAITLAKLAARRYVAMTENGPIVTGDGLMRLMERPSDGSEYPA